MLKCAKAWEVWIIDIKTRSRTLCPITYLKNAQGSQGRLSSMLILEDGSRRSIDQKLLVLGEVCT